MCSKKDEEENSITLKLYEIKVGGKIWQFRRTDPDIRIPSGPHGHNKEDIREKLNPYNGEMVRDGGIIGKLKTKDLKLVKEKLEEKKFI